ncbi:MAG: cytochrome C oxidase subunit IV family protein [Mariniblastus sp.]|nr:cytochrome C oxidase subunit IV family protein [Mariniblastus sp.]
MQTDAPSQSSPTSQHRVFLVVFGLLVVLTGLSFWIANSAIMENRILGWSVMIGISICKAMLVVAFFMHLWWERAWKYALTIPTLFMGCMLVLLLVPDIGMRTDHYPRSRQRLSPESITVPNAPGYNEPQPKSSPSQGSKT